MRPKVLYTILAEIFSEETGSSSIRKQKILALIMSMQLLAQNINFMWNPYLDMDNWKTYIDFWVVLNYPCIDSLAASLGLLKIFMYLVISLISTNAILVITILLLNASSKQVPNFLLKSLRLNLKFTCELYFIPTSIILIMLFKYSTIEIHEIQEYANLPDSQIMNFGALGQIFSIIFLLIHALFSIIYEGCYLEIRHSLCETNLHAKSSPKIEILIKIIYFINCIFFTNIQLSNYFAHMIILSITYAYCTYKYIYYLPYYSTFMNYIKILVHFEAFCISAFFVLASFIGNSTIVFVLTIFMQPIIIILSKFAIDYRMRIANKPKKQTESSLIVFELAIRKRLMSTENSKKLIEYINLHYENKKNKLVLVYLAYYCKDIQENTNIAGIVISRVDYKGFDFITNFQIFKCQKILEKENFQKSEGLRMSSYLIVSDKVISNEKKFCLNLLNIIKKLNKENIKISAFEKLVISCNDNLKTVKKNYEKLIETFPDAKETYKNYGTFLSKITFEENYGNQFINKYNFETYDSRANSKKLNLFSHYKSYILITSGNPQSFGKIIYANLNICKLFQLSLEDYKDSFFQSFIPKPIYEMLNVQMIKLIVKSETNFLFIKDNFFMLDFDGFLIECIISTECLGYNEGVKFVSVIQSVNNKYREIGLISEDYRIINHTRNFTRVMNLNFYKAESLYLIDCMPKNIFKQLLKNKQIVYSPSNDGSKYGLIIKEIPFLTSKLRVLYILNNPIDLLIPSQCIDTDITYEIMYDKIQNQIHINSQERLNSRSCDNEKTLLSKIESNQKLEEDLNLKNEKELFLTNNLAKTSIDGIISIDNKNKSHTTRSLLFLKILKIITGIYVIILLSIIIGFCGYISKELNNLAHRQTFSDLHDMNFHFSRLVYNTLLLDLGIHLSIPKDYLFQIYNESITTLNAMQENLHKDYRLLSSCPNSDIFYNPKILVYKDIKTDYYRDSLAGILENTIANARYYMNSLQKMDTDDHKLVFYILYNTFRIAINEFSLAISGFLDCEIEKVNEKSIVVWYYNIIAIVIILAIGCIIIVLSGKNCANIGKSWTKFSKSVRKSQNTVKNATIQHLDTYSSKATKEILGIYEENLENIENFQIKRKYQHIIRVAILISVSIGAMVIVSEVLYKQSQKTVIFNNKVFNNLMIQSTQIWKFGYFTLEALAYKESYDFSEYTNLTIYPYYMDSINKTLLEIKDLQHVIEQYSIEGKIPNELVDLLYFNVTKYGGEEKSGIFTVVNDLFDDSKNYIYSTSDLNIDSLQKFAYSVGNIAFALRNTSFYGHDVMKNEVLYICTILGIFFTLIVLLLIILSICINFRYLNYERKVLESIEGLKKIFECAEKINK
ncbi:hypothetical protein SteCoe_35768 [Stentor coeruleus]|uniref:PAS domain-containing protein n=1 Tax=Stentor coeruleus TaxID=5963 RepID=A0A1R2ARN1_9CILI|nr:hypothetical protein SteCoe_35768 [Stentor coeruleus]